VVLTANEGSKALKGEKRKGHGDPSGTSQSNFHNFMDPLSGPLGTYPGTPKKEMQKGGGGATEKKKKHTNKKTGQVKVNPNFIEISPVKDLMSLTTNTART